MAEANEMMRSSGLRRLRLVTPPSSEAQDAENAKLARALRDGEARAAELAGDRYAPLVHEELAQLSVEPVPNPR